MSYTTAYHATPFMFDTLKPGSWLSDKPWEAVLHLTMKNAAEERPRFDGYLLTFPMVSVYCIQNIVNINGVFIFKNMDPLKVMESNRVSIPDAIASFPRDKQLIFEATPVLDLTPFLQQET